MRLTLEAYECHVFVDWRHVVDGEAWPWAALAERLAGRGVPGADAALRLLLLEPAHAALRSVLDPALVGSMVSADAAAARETARAVEEAGRRVRALLAEAQALAKRNPDLVGGEFRGDLERAAQGFESRLKAALKLGALEARLGAAWPPETRALLTGESAALGGIMAWAVLEALGTLADPAAATDAAARTFDAFRFRAVLAEAFEALGLAGEDRWRAAARVRLAHAHARAAATGARTSRPATLDWLNDPDAAWLTSVNEYQGVRYFVQEPYERLVWWLALPALLGLAAQSSPSSAAVRALEKDVAARVQVAAASGYRVEPPADPPR
jgi:hypothetical protein